MRVSSKNKTEQSLLLTSRLTRLPQDILNECLDALSRETRCCTIAGLLIHQRTTSPALSISTSSAEGVPVNSVGLHAAHSLHPRPSATPRLLFRAGIRHYARRDALPSRHSGRRDTSTPRRPRPSSRPSRPVKKTLKITATGSRCSPVPQEAAITLMARSQKASAPTAVARR
jgi:hypothetical protein